MAPRRGAMVGLATYQLSNTRRKQSEAWTYSVSGVTRASCTAGLMVEDAVALAMLRC